MATLKYADVYSSFLGNVTDYNLAALNPNDAYAQMNEYMHKAVAVPEFRGLFSSIKLDDDIMNITYELKYVVDEDTDKEFIINVLGELMSVKWLEPQVASKINIAQMYAGKEEKFYSQSAHLDSIKDLLARTEINALKTIRDRGSLWNSYIDGV